MKHVIADAYDVSNVDALKNLSALQNVVREVARSLQLTVVAEAGHQFEPFGATCVLVLAESHLSAHTWYERNQVHLDLFTCAGEELDVPRFVSLLQDGFATSQISFKVIDRPLSSALPRRSR